MTYIDTDGDSDVEFPVYDSKQYVVYHSKLVRTTITIKGIISYLVISSSISRLLEAVVVDL